MPSDPRLLALPAIRAEAERLAKELYGAEPQGTSFRSHTATLAVTFGWLLADISRPESRDALVRLCIERETRIVVEMDASAHMPRWCVTYATTSERLLCGYDSHEAAADAIPGIIRWWWRRLRDDPDALATAALEVLHAE